MLLPKINFINRVWAIVCSSLICYVLRSELTWQIFSSFNYLTQIEKYRLNLHYKPNSIFQISNQIMYSLMCLWFECQFYLKKQIYVKTTNTKSRINKKSLNYSWFKEINKISSKFLMFRKTVLYLHYFVDFDTSVTKYGNYKREEWLKEIRQQTRLTLTGYRVSRIPNVYRVMTQKWC